VLITFIVARLILLKVLNSANLNSITLYIAPSCMISKSNTSAFNSLIKTISCGIHAPRQGGSVGCSISIQASNIYSDSFNSVGGSIYVIE
jgi:hypothetical protein